MRCPFASVFLFTSALGAHLVAQSTQLSALDGSVPASAVDPIAQLPTGISGVFGDPTLSPRVTGAFLSMYNASYASVRLFQAAVGWKLGPRWSVSIASTEIGGLFDSSLTRQDPGLASLRAKATLGAIDATTGTRRIVASLGVGIAGDDNVGDRQTSTLMRAHVRLSPFGQNVSFGAHWASVVGGSVQERPGSRRGFDISISRALGPLIARVTGARQWGSLWRYSEVASGSAVAATLVVLSQVDLSVGLGRYETSYGASRYEWQRSVAAGLLLRDVRVSVRYTSTALGLGSGYGVSVAYEPQASPPTPVR